MGVRLVVSYHEHASPVPRFGRAGDRNASYWQMIAVHAATLRHVAGPDPVFEVWTGGPPPSGDITEVLAGAGAEVRFTPFDHEPPPDFYHRYLGALYVFDVIQAVAAEAADDEVVLFVDPDIVWAGRPDPLVAEARRGGIVAYDLGVPDTVPMVGLSRREQAAILAEMIGGPPASPSPVHFGGEFYGMLGAELRPFAADVEQLWGQTLDRYQRGLLHFRMEEHHVNAVLWQRGEQRGRANAHLQRIRTVPPPFGTRDRVHPGLVAWHLPLEKNRAFPRMFRHLASGRALPPPGAEYTGWLARRMGVVPVGARWLADCGHRAKWALTRKGRAGHHHGL